MPISDATIRIHSLSMHIRMNLKNFLNNDFSGFQINFICTSREFNKAMFKMRDVKKYT